MSTIITENFIKKANLIYNNKYDYSKVEYKNSYTKIIIYCPTHSTEFLSTPNNHLMHKISCQKCRSEKLSKLRSQGIKTFIENANLIHNNKYDYSKVKYINNKTEVCIICLEHGEFWQRPDKHINSKQGCPKCQGYNKTNQNFIQQAKQIHGDKYDYSKIIYQTATKKICITCSKHGNFLQQPNNHLSNQGCPKCQRSKGEEQISKWLTEHNIYFETQKRFNECKNKRSLPFDFYLPNHNLLIEYDGEQHFNPYRGRQQDKYIQKLKQVQHHDFIKNNYCKQNNIQLIRIPYWKPVESFLDNVCSINVLSSNAPL